MKLKHIFLFVFIFIITTVASATYVYFSIGKDDNIHTPSEINITQDNILEPETEVDINSNDIIEEEIENIRMQPKEEPLTFIMPVNSSNFGMPFSDGQLIYSKTLNEWRTHNGIDILEKCGTPVFAVESGTIKEIISTPDEGIKITIEHKDGYKSVYSNLSTTKMVNLNDKVEKGQVISGIGKTAAFEYQEPDHLHFEMYKDGIVINPLDVIALN